MKHTRTLTVTEFAREKGISRTAVLNRIERKTLKASRDWTKAKGNYVIHVTEDKK